MSLLKFNCFIKIESSGSSLEHYYSSPLCFCLATSLLVLDTLRSGTDYQAIPHLYILLFVLCVCVFGFVGLGGQPYCRISPCLLCVKL